MLEYMKESDNRDMLFGNAVIRHIQTDAAAGTLRLRALYADREYMDITYEGVYYCQLDERFTGCKIVLAEAVTPSVLRSHPNRAMTERMLKDCGCENTDFLYQLAGRGHRLFVHYVEKNDAQIVVAKNISIQ